MHSLLFCPKILKRGSPMNVITALNNQPVQDLLKKKCPGMEFPIQDITYQEALFEALKTIKTDAILINMSIEGELSPQDFITQVRSFNPTAKIVLVMKEDNESFRNWLVTKAVYDTFIDGQCTFEDIKAALSREREVIIKKEVVVEEKVLEKEKVVTREKIVKVGFKKLILPIIDSTELACEMAFCAARLTGMKVALVNLDTVKGYLDIYLGIKRPEKNDAFLFLAETRGGRTPNEAILDVCFEKPLNNLYLLDLAAIPERLLNTVPSEFLDMLLACYSLFDLTVISLPWGSPYIRHAATVGEYTIVTAEAYRDQSESAMGLSEKELKGVIPIERQLLLFREYKSDVCLSELYLKERLGERYLGKILYDDARCRSRNRDCPEGCYIGLCYPYIRPQYAAVLGRFDIYGVPAASAIGNILKTIMPKKGKAADDSQYTSHDLLFAFKEAIGILSYTGYLSSRYFMMLMKSILNLLKIFFNPLLIIFVLILVIIMALTGTNPGDILKILSQILHQGAN